MLSHFVNLRGCGVLTAIKLKHLRTFDQVEFLRSITKQ